jgi:23S rRNA (adenine2503-C2)-methyltransferase
MKSIYDCERVDLAQSLSPSYRSTQIFKSLYQRWLESFDDMTEIPKAERTSLADEWDLRLPEVHRRFDSTDGTRRYLIRLHDGELAETVFLPEDNRNTICISSQIGCALACSFCLTGLMGLARNLSAGEIVTQVLLAQRGNLSGEARDSFNIVLMGMGEPLHNYDNVMKAIRILHDTEGLNMSMSRITLSTAGLLPGIERLAREDDIPNLAISLTGATNEKRNDLMPINRKYPIEEILEAVKRFPLKHRQRVTFEYVLLKGETDGVDDARMLARLLSGMPAKVNLIPFNEAEELQYRRPSESTIVRFQEVLQRGNVDAFVRKNRGNDISAACGQLKRKWADASSPL